MTINTGTPGRDNAMQLGIDRCLDRATDSRAHLPSKVLWTVCGLARAAGRYDDADTLLDTIEERDGVTVKLMEERARVAFGRGDTEIALAILSERYDRSPSATALIAIARLNLDAGDIAEAARLSNELASSHGDLATVKQLTADVARADGRRELSRSYYLGMVDDRPEHPPSLLSLAQLSLDEGDRESATSFFRRAVAAAGETLTANQLAQAAALADCLAEIELAAAFKERAAAMQSERTHRLLDKIDGVLADLPPSPLLPAAGRPARTAAPAARQAGRTRNAPREHEVALHAAHGSVTPDEPRVLTALKDAFGHEDLRPGQSAVIAQVLDGLDTLAIMPTGSGKSLTFQLPAMLDARTTVVVSPLIALMKDQVESLPDAVRARTALINSTLTTDAMRQRLDQLARGEIKLVYVAPERLRNYGFLRALREAGVSRVVVDEAHCISMWGHDFRPDYLFIPRAVTELGEPPVLAITATATPDMVEQIGGGLGRDLRVVRTSIFRPNLRYEVHHLERKEAKLERIAEICRAERGAGIVYVSSRRDAESIATLLKDRGVNALPYHAGLDPATRGANQDLFMSGRARVVVATIAFGMGVNKADVRFIIHVVPSRSLEAYAQESGRAGRDGHRARCILLVSPFDRGQLVSAARRDEMDISALRRVYAQLMRQANGSWVITDPSTIRASTPDDVDEPDSRVALGILEQAGLIRRHPDAPVSYEVRRLSQRMDASLEAALVPAWTAIQTKLPASWLERGVCTVITAELASQTSLAPAEIDRVFQAHPSLSVRQGQRSMALYLDSISGDAASTLQAILDRARDAARTRIDQVMSYANCTSCRHAALAAHLGERMDACGTSCDVCTGTAENIPARASSRSARSAVTPQDALAVLEAVRTLPYPMGKLGLVRLLTGSIESRLRADRSNAFGTLSELAKSRVDSLVDRLVDGGFLLRDMDHEYRLISLTPRGSSAGLTDLQEFDQTPSRQTSADVPDLEPSENRLYERLAEWRRNRAAEESVPPYVVAHNSMLRNLAASRPVTKTALLAVPGFGPARVDKYGSELLAVINPTDVNI